MANGRTVAQFWVSQWPVVKDKSVFDFCLLISISFEANESV
jgi:hypothetical protein